MGVYADDGQRQKERIKEVVEKVGFVFNYKIKFHIYHETFSMSLQICVQ